MLHYYFSDKEDLITHCVRQYEAACVTRYDEIVATASSAEELKREFSAAMALTLRTDAPMHRLWYDLRNQSLFEESFRADVLEIDQRREEMIWRVISRYASFAGIEVALSPRAAYAILDGLFQQALLHHLAGNEDAAEDLRANVVRVLDILEVREARQPESQRDRAADPEVRRYHLDGGQGGGDALDHLGEDRVRGGEVEPEGSGSARAEGGSVHDRDARPVGDEHAG